jgi:hypothetical protein
MLHILLASITPSSQITRVIRCTRTARVSQAMYMRARKAVRRAHIRCMLQMRRQPRKSVWVSSGLNKKNIRVVVKSTGHSITGCSVGAASLSIWTHYLRGISYISDFMPTSFKAGKGVQAARIAAGHTVIDVLRAMAKHNAVAITGANPSVEIVG